MNASSESGLCATVMVSAALTGRFYDLVDADPALLDLTCIGGKATMKSSE